MRTILLAVVVALAWGTIAVAGGIMITLEPVPSAIGPADFYIDSVIDGRGDTATIGFGLTGIFNNRSDAYLAPDFKSGLAGYFNSVLPPDSAKSPVAVKFLEFRVGEKSGFSGEYGMFWVKMNFYALAGGELKYLFTADDYVKESGMDVTSGHKRRIVEGLNKCLLDFMRWRAHPESTAVGETAAGQSSSPPDTLSRTIKSVPKYASRSIIALSGSYGANSGSGGIWYSRYTIKGRWYPMLAYGIIYRTVDYSTAAERYKGSFLDLAIAAGAIRPFAQQRSGLRLLGSVPFGYETIREPDGSTSKPRFFIGIELSQCFMALPPKTGVSLALGPYERAIFNSEAYPWDVGVTAHLGVQF